MNANSTLRAVVEPGGKGVVAHVGLHALGSFGDRLGLGDCLSARVTATGERAPLHDRGKVLCQAMLMLAGGGEACTDIEVLRAQPELFGSVPSDSTLYRTLRRLDPATVSGCDEAMAEIRAKVWRRSSATNTTAPVVLDIDSSLVEIHSENKEVAGSPSGEPQADGGRTIGLRAGRRRDGVALRRPATEFADTPRSALCQVR